MLLMPFLHRSCLLIVLLSASPAISGLRAEEARLLPLKDGVKTKQITFEDPKDAPHWLGGQCAGGGIAAVTFSSEQAHSGKSSLRLGYELAAVDGYFEANAGHVDDWMEGEPTGFSVWVYGDGSRHNLHYAFGDSAGKTWHGYLAKVDWTGWRELRGELNSKIGQFGGSAQKDTITFPVKFSRFTISGEKPEPRRGAIFIDDLTFTIAVPEDDILARAASAWPNALGSEANPQLQVTLNNTSEQERIYKVQTTLRDFYGQEFPFAQNIAVPAKSIRIETLAITLPHQGYYEATVKVADTSARNQSVVHLGWIPENKVTGPQPASPFGVNGHSGHKIFPVFKRLGVDWSRTDFDWPLVQPAQDVWLFDEMDRIVDEAQSAGISILAVIGKNPPWVKPADGHGTDHAAYLAFVEKLVGRYHDKVKAWDLWNEPDLSWRGTPAEFGELCAKSYAVIKKIDPDAIVVCPGTSGDDLSNHLRSFTRPFVAGSGGKFPGDVLALHPYSRPKPSEGIHLRERLLEAAEWLLSIGSPRPIWASEVGWSTSNDWLGNTEIEQAAYLTRIFAICFSADVQKVMWYQPFSSDDRVYSEAQYGFLRSDNTPKPSAVAYAQMTHMLRDAVFEQPITLSDAIRGYLFRKGDQAIALVWSVEQTAKMTTKWPASVKMTGVDGTPLSPQDGVLNLNVRPVYLTVPLKDKAALVAAITGAEISGLMPLRFASTMESHDLLMRLKEQNNRPLSGKISIFATDFESKKPLAEAAFKLAARQESDVRIPISLPPGLNTKLTARVEVPGQSAFTFPITAGRLDVPSNASTVVVDGNLGDWKEAPTFTLLERGDVAPADEVRIWRDAEDLGARGWLRWDQKGLYLAVEVQDDIHLNSQHGAGIWAGDSLQVGVEGAKGIIPPNFSETGSEIALALTAKGVEIVNLTGRTLDKDQYQAAVVRDETKKRTYYELFLSWASLNMKVPQANDAISFNIVVNEDDGTGRKHWLQLSPGIADEKKPSAYPRAILLPGR